MLPLDPSALRASLVNASRKEASDMTPPPDLGSLDWEQLDLLGWRDPKLPRRAYVVLPGHPDDDDRPRGVLLRQAEAVPRRRAQCAWCQDVTLPNDVVFYAARRAGAAGRVGATVGTLLCRDFECSRNVRVLPPLAYEGFDREAARQQRVAVLRERSRAFLLAVLGDEHAG
ncbi:FBP C-terminal treble-clef zinc-finger [Quadrisphaera granulorum]|uniref:Treble-clef zinc-finger protein n=2 Tax=Quadrisphaera granulorum TaxID=317664 RepID=A0A316A6U2_9ACTN|nr:treble-clef zinc-finger protein [Quadrisphaera granulorum]SZE96645.1 FBP C-terminal treble-clef zinc-finger [Quadrisphaera granulorum]